MKGQCIGGSNGANVNRLRVDSCIFTILEIKKKMKNLKNVDPVFMFQFNKLEAIIPKLKAENISCSEVDKIEDATNNLFEQMKPLFGKGREFEIYDGLKH